MKLTIMNEQIAIDTNVIIYALNDAHPAKRAITLNIFSNVPFLSSQSLSETINVCHRKWKYDKRRQIKVADFLLNNCRFEPVNEATLRLSHKLITDMIFSILTPSL